MSLRASKTVLIAGFLIALFGCASPETRVSSPDSRPTLAVVGAPEGAQLYVDGVLIGAARKYDGNPRLLTVTPGQHLIEVRSKSGDVLVNRKSFFSSDLKEIRVGGE